MRCLLAVAVLEVAEREETVGLYQLNQIGVVYLHGDVAHQRHVLDKPAGLSFGSVRWTDKTPLAGMNCARTSNLEGKL